MVTAYTGDMPMDLLELLARRNIPTEPSVGTLYNTPTEHTITPLQTIIHIYYQPNVAQRVPKHG